MHCSDTQTVHTMASVVISIYSASVEFKDSTVFWEICVSVYVCVSRQAETTSSIQTLNTRICGLHMSLKNYHSKFCRVSFTQEKRLANTLQASAWCTVVRLKQCTIMLASNTKVKIVQAPA